MLFVKAFHIIAMVAWFSGLFYLPRLFVYHAESQDNISLARFKIMERRLYYGIIWPAGLITSIFGGMLFFYNTSYYLQAGWMHAKLSLVIVLWIYHLLCGHYRKQFFINSNKHTSRFYRFFNEIPTILLIGIILLVILKPSL